MIMETHHKAQWVVTLIIAISAFSKNIWMFTLVILLGMLLMGMKKLYKTSLFETDAYTYLAFPVSFRDVCLARVITGGTQLLMLNSAMIAEVEILRFAVFGGKHSVLGGNIFSWFMNSEGDNAFAVMALQALDGVLLCYCVPSIILMLNTMDKIVINNGHYASTILFAIFVLLGFWMIAEGYSPTLKLALIQTAVLCAAIPFCLWQSWMFMKQLYYIRNPIDY